MQRNARLLYTITDPEIHSNGEYSMEAIKTLSFFHKVIVFLNRSTVNLLREG